MFMREAAWIAFAPFIFAYKAAALLVAGAKWAVDLIKQLRRAGTFGDAHWATTRELRRAGNLSGNGYVVGKLNGCLVRTHSDYSCLMFGRPGSGKSLTMGATLHAASGETFIVFDPPGDLRMRFGEHLRGRDYLVQEINLDRPKDGLRYDVCLPLDGASAYERESRVNLLAELATADLHDGGRNSEHFAETSRIMIEKVLGWLHANQRSKASLDGVAEVLLATSDVERTRIFKDIVATGDSSARAAVNMWETAKSANGGEASGFRSSVTRALEPWMKQSIRDLTGGERAAFEWDAILASPRPVALFLTGGVGRAKEIKSFVRVFFGQGAAAVASLYAKAGRLPRNTRFMIDEGIVLGRCEPVLSAVEEMRKAGVSVFIGYQSFGQLTDIWGKKAQNLRDSCDLIVCGGGKSVKEYAELSELIGTRTVMSQTLNDDRRSQSETSRPLIAVEEIFNLSVDEHLCFLGTQTLKARKAYTICNGSAHYHSTEQSSWR